jgi:hypothetical protein
MTGWLKNYLLGKHLIGQDGNKFINRQVHFPQQVDVVETVRISGTISFSWVGRFLWDTDEALYRWNRQRGSFYVLRFAIATERIWGKQKDFDDFTKLEWQDAYRINLSNEKNSLISIRFLRDDNNLGDWHAGCSGTNDAQPLGGRGE